MKEIEESPIEKFARKYPELVRSFLLIQKEARKNGITIKEVNLMAGLCKPTEYVPEKFLGIKISCHNNTRERKIELKGYKNG